MRKILLLIALFAGFGMQQVHAQACTPSPIFVLLGIPGIYPNPIQQSSLASGSVGSAYSTTLTLIVVGDTTIDLSAQVGFPVPPVTADIEDQRINNVTGLPAGLSYACSPSSCSVKGDSAGCIILQGTPTQSGSFTVGVDTEIGINVPATVPIIGGQVVYIPIPGISYDLEITSGVGIEELREDVFSVVQNGPNPFHDFTEIFYNAPKPTQVDFQVTDLSGKVMHHANHRAVTGQNVIKFDASGMSAGTYLYRLSNGENSVTHKMVILK